jgi:shikimate kinase
MIFSTTGSLVLESDAIEYIRERMVTLYLDLPDGEIGKRARARGVSRVVGMNGENPRFKSVEEVLIYRRSFYERYADFRIALESSGTPEEDAERVVEFVEKNIKL